MVKPGRMSFELNSHRSGLDPTPRENPSRFCMLVCADLAGATRPALGARQPVRVDVDNFEQVVTRMASRVQLSAQCGGGVLDIAALDDFHPDRLLLRLPAFARLRELRADLDDPARRAQAEAMLQGDPTIPTASSVADETLSDIERLLGRKPGAAPSSLTEPTNPVDEWIRALVAPHVRPTESAQHRMLVRSVDMALADLMRSVLHDAPFQRLEATWRGIARLVAELGGEASIELWLLDVDLVELVADARAAADDLGRSAMAGHLCGPDASGVAARTWAMVVVDHAFGMGHDDLVVLAALGSLASRCGAALLADGHPALLGCRTAQDLAEPARWVEPAPNTASLWQSVRALGASSSIALALPRVLMRRPYGSRSDPVASFDLQEIVDPNDDASYLWGSAAMALAWMAGCAFRDKGWNMALDEVRELPDLPAFSWRDADGEVALRPCAEVLLGQRAAERMLAAGLMPVLARRDRHAVQLLRWQSLADPPQALRGPWSA